MVKVSYTPRQQESVSEIQRPYSPFTISSPPSLFSFLYDKKEGGVLALGTGSSPLNPVMTVRSPIGLPPLPASGYITAQVKGRPLLTSSTFPLHLRFPLLSSPPTPH